MKWDNAQSAVDVTKGTALSEARCRIAPQEVCNEACHPEGWIRLQFNRVPPFNFPMPDATSHVQT